MINEERLVEIRRQWDMPMTGHPVSDHAHQRALFMDIPWLLELVDTEQSRVRSLSADIDRCQHNLEVALKRVQELETALDTANILLGESVNVSAS